ncbi:MAG: 16S rRNA (adenine(1518)-N(6)/adenine(1519)-N(6))-dimethyltransferase RsmA [Anaerolineales bacterium]
MDNPINLPDLNVVELLKSHGIQPDKRLGQNFLIDPMYLHRVADAGNITKDDTVLEVGAGLGSLTRLLGSQAKEVFAVELDTDLIPILKQVTIQFSNIQIIHRDILKIDPGELTNSTSYLVVANIPYYITSNLIRHLLAGNTRPRRVVLTIQREVAERICAQPNKLSLLGLSVQVFGLPKILSRVPAGAFYPVPKVDSAIIRIEIYPAPIIPADQLDIFFQIAKAGFSQKRKMLRNSLSAGLRQDRSIIENLLLEADIEPQRRAQTLTLDEWKLLTSGYIKLGTQD